MNTSTLHSLLNGTVNSYVGTFSCNNLPDEQTGIIVSNLDPDYLPGTHWIAMYVSDDRLRGEYFDSFGRPPKGVFNKYMNEHCENWTYNRKQLQSIVSKYCGHYCFLYCVYRGRGFDMNFFVNLFTTDTGFNDKLVDRTFRHLLAIR